MSVVFRKVYVDGCQPRQWWQTGTLPSEMSVMCGQLRWFQLLAELRLLQLVEVGPGADMGCRKSREPETRNE